MVLEDMRYGLLDDHSRMASSLSTYRTAASARRTHFKTPEGRYNLQSEKTSTVIFYFTREKVQRVVPQVTIAHLNDKATSALSSDSNASFTSGVRSAAARFLGGGYGNRALDFVVGSGSSKSFAGNSRSSFSGSIGTRNSLSTLNYDGKGSYLIFNEEDVLFISDLNSQDKDPIKLIVFVNLKPTCHAFNSEANDGHDLLIGFKSGDVYSVSLRQQLQDVGKKLVGVHNYKKDTLINNSQCTSIAWIPGGGGSFAVAHADGNIYVYEKNKDSTGDSSFPVITDQMQFSIARPRSSQSNPISRWHVCQGSINCISFSRDGTHLATVGRDGYLRVFDFFNAKLIYGGKSYYGALLCCAWSPDGKYILTGGEDDLVQVWSMEDRKIVAWGEGHNSWVSGVAFDPYWSSPASDGSEGSAIYRFGSVGQDGQLLLWDLENDEIVVPLRRCLPAGCPTTNDSQSTPWDDISQGVQPVSTMQDVPKITPTVAHLLHTEPFSGLIFTSEYVLTACREGRVMIWTRPGNGENHSNT